MVVKKLKTLKKYLNIFIKRQLAGALYAIDYDDGAKGRVKTIGISSGVNNVTFEGKNGINYGSEFFGDIKIGYATTLGFHNAFHGDITIGRYCQFGASVAIHTNDHPTNHLSTYISSELFNGELSSLKINKKVVVGNDVWVGHGVTILGGVKIGNGAIIAAGSVVTKDVDSYTIVAGVPAKKIKQRFSNEIITQIEELQWWDKNEEELEKIKPLFFKDITKIKNLYEEKK